MCAESGSTLRLQFPVEDLGFAYPTGTGTGTGTGTRSVARTGDDAGISGPSAPLYPPGTLVPGARLPHARLVFPAVSDAPASTHDLVEPCALDALAREDDAAAANAGTLGARVPGPVFALIVAVEDDPAAVVAAETRARTPSGPPHPSERTLDSFSSRETGRWRASRGRGTGTGTGTGDGDERGRARGAASRGGCGRGRGLVGDRGRGRRDAPGRVGTAGRTRVAWVGGARPPGRGRRRGQWWGRGRRGRGG